MGVYLLDDESNRLEPAYTTSLAELYGGAPSVPVGDEEVLGTAYFAGFFDWPRASTGEDVAELLGVPQPTVNRHLRLA